MAVKISKGKNKQEVDQNQDDLLELSEWLQGAQELEVSTVKAIYALKPFAFIRLKALLNSPDSRTALAATKLVIEYGNN